VLRQLRDRPNPQVPLSARPAQKQSAHWSIDPVEQSPGLAGVQPGAPPAQQGTPPSGAPGTSSTGTTGNSTGAGGGAGTGTTTTAMPPPTGSPRKQSVQNSSGAIALDHHALWDLYTGGLPHPAGFPHATARVATLGPGNRPPRHLPVP